MYVILKPWQIFRWGLEFLMEASLGGEELFCVKSLSNARFQPSVALGKYDMVVVNNSTQYL